MAENPKGSRGRLTLVTQLSIAAAVGLVVLVAWIFSVSRRSEPEPQRPAAPPPAVQSPAPTVSEEALSRAEMILEARAIAAAYAAAEQRPLDGADPLVGRRFSLRIPFGCDGPASGSTSAQAYYEIDAEKHTLRLVARPVDWSGSPFGQEDREAKFEAIEGFWIPRPWNYSESCPPKRETAPSAASTPASAQTLGIATFFEAGGSRVQRRTGRPYEHVQKIEVGEPLPIGSSYRLVLEGKLTALPTGRVVRCWSESSDHRPVCLFAAGIDRVAFEDQDGKLLAEWKGD